MAKYIINKALFDTKMRENLAEKGEAMSDGSFPIRNKSDLKNALHSIGRAKDYEKAKRWITKRAKELDLVDMLPEDWNVKDNIEKAALSGEQQKKVSKVMREFAAGKLKSSSGQVVTDKKQALAIAYSEAEKV